MFGNRFSKIFKKRKSAEEDDEFLDVDDHTATQDHRHDVRLSQEDERGLTRRASESNQDAADLAYGEHDSIPVDDQYGRDDQNWGVESEIIDETQEKRKPFNKNLHWYIVGFVILFSVGAIFISEGTKREQVIKENKITPQAVSGNEDKPINREQIDLMASAAASDAAAQTGNKQASAVDPVTSYIDSAPSNKELEKAQPTIKPSVAPVQSTQSTPGSFGSLPPPPGQGVGISQGGSSSSGGKSSSTGSGDTSTQTAKDKETLRVSPLIKLSGSAKAGDGASKETNSKIDKLREDRQSTNDVLKTLVQQRPGTSTALSDSTAISGRGNLQGRAGGNPSAAQISEQWAKDNDKVAPPQTIKSTPAHGDCNILHQGKIIPAVLELTLNSDLPGNIVGVISQDVYDSVCGDNLLISKGSRFYGVYGSAIQNGQERIMAGVNRIVMLNGVTISLGQMNMVDSEGATGVEADVNNHILKQVGAGIMLAWITGVIEKATATDKSVSGSGTYNSNTMSGAGQVMTDTAKRVLDRYGNVQPTLKVYKGQKFNIMVNKDIELPTYRPRR